MDWLTSPVWKLAIAAAIGVWIGTERERRKGEGSGRSSAGLRTFVLVALLGGIAQLAGGCCWGYVPLSWPGLHS